MRDFEYQMTKVDPNSTARLAELISEARRVGIATHTHPDGDALGSSVAMCTYLRDVCGKEVVYALPNPAPHTISFILAGEQPLVCDHCPELTSAELNACDLIICLDFNNFSRTDSLADILAASKAKKVLIDHHLNPSEADFDLVFSTPEVSSASELLYWILRDMPGIDGNAAALPVVTREALLTGMTTDSNNFANSVFPSTLQMASELLAAGTDRDAILEKLYNNYRENRVRAISGILYNNLKIRDNGIAYIVLTKAEWDAYGLMEGELEGMVNIPLSIDRVKVSIYLREDEGHFRVSIRSKRGYSANAIARTRFNGGGHEQAAGGKLYFPQDIAKPEDAAQYLETIEVL